MRKLANIENAFLSTLRSGISKNETERHFQYFNTDDWQRLLDIVVETGLFPAFYTRLLDLNLKNIPSQFLLKLKNQYYFNLKRTIMLEKELFRVLEYLNKKNIPAIPLKGPILARLLYSDVALRRSSIAGEMDVLVHKHNLIAAENIIKEAGYFTNEDAIEKFHRFRTQILFCRNDPWMGPFQVDLHWGMRDRFMRAHLEDFWLNAKELKVDNYHVLLPSKEDLLLYLGLISVYDGAFIKIRHIYDIHSLISKFNKEMNWCTLSDTARQYNLDAILFFILKLSKDLFHTEIPADLSKAIRPGFIKENLARHRFNRKNVLRAAEKISNSFIWHYFVSNYLFSKGMADYLKLVYKKIFRPMDEVVWAYHSHMQSGVSYNLYIRRLIKPFFNTLKRKNEYRYFQL